MVNVYWTGAAGLEFDFEGQTILVDPYYTGISLLNLFLGKVLPNLRLLKKLKK